MTRARRAGRTRSQTWTRYALCVCHFKAVSLQSTCNKRAGLSWIAGHPVCSCCCSLHVFICMYNAPDSLFSAGALHGRCMINSRQALTGRPQ